MSHIPLTYVPMSDNNTKKYIYNVPNGGMLLSESERFFDGSNKCAVLSNLEVQNGILKTRSPQQSLVSVPKGSINGLFRETFCDRFIIHIGNSLYSYAGENEEFLMLSSVLPDKKSLICHFMSKLYIYCDGHVFSLDEQMAFKEEYPDAALLYENVSPAAGSMAKRIKDAPYNLLSPRIKVNYSASSSTSFYTPVRLDTSKKVVFIIDDEVLDESEYTVYENRIVCSYGNDTERAASLEYYPKDAENIGYDPMLYDCCLCESFGGSSGGGTRIFFTGDKNKKGKYYKSALQNPLYVASDETEYIGDGCENVTSLIKMYGDLIIFTEKSVFKMEYNLNSDGVFFSVKQISHAVGCDLPYSVQLVDNRAVFANSEKGIFIVSSTNEVGEQNVKPVSGNVFTPNSKQLLSSETDFPVVSCSVDFDRKYYLFIKGKAYIWDYDEGGYVDSTNYSLSQSRLKWYTYENVFGDFFFVLGGVIYSLDTQSGTVYSFCDDNSQKPESVFDSGMLSFDKPFDKKILTSVEIVTEKQTDGDMTLEILADDKVIMTHRLSAVVGKKIKLRIKPPCSHSYGYGIRIRSLAGYKLYGAAFIYKIIT